MNSRPDALSDLSAGEALLDSDPAAAADKARHVLTTSANDPNALRLLGAALRRLGQSDEANRAELAAIDASAREPDLSFAANCMMQNRLPEAEAALRQILQRRPGDVAAIRMLAEIAARFGHLRDAEEMLREALTRAPGFDFARLHLASVLLGLSRAGDCLQELDKLGDELSQLIEAKELRASALARTGDYADAIRIYTEIAGQEPARPAVWTSLAFLYKIMGDEGEAIAAYRKALEISAADGDAWYGLADMKTISFSDADVVAMEEAIGSPAIAEGNRFQIEFALAKAYEDRSDPAKSFAYLRSANATRATQVGHDPQRAIGLVDRSIQLFTRDFLDRPGGSPAPDPIFILGLPRSGSTLVEQIIASHPLVEGTGELPDIIAIAQSLEPAGPVGRGWTRYPFQLAELDPDEITRLGELYLERTRIQRKTDRPRFIDKMPNNWLHVGMIMRILPNAKIVDARRSPMACGFSNFKQHYARGQEFSYDLSHIGEYYRAYIRLMRHFDQVRPGAIHHVIHEKLVSEPETEIRALLDYLELEFDEACLRFHQSERPVRSASAQQVRRPISRDGAEQWRSFEAYLDPLKAALGPVLEDWQ